MDKEKIEKELAYCKAALEEFTNMKKEDFVDGKISIKKKTGTVKNLNFHFNKDTSSYLIENILTPFIEAEIGLLETKLDKINNEK